MKKFITVIALTICVGIISGCSASEKTITCTLSQNTIEYNLQATYKIYAKGSVVEKVETVETVTSSDEEVLETLQKTVEEQYKNFNQLYGGYTYDVVNDGSKVESKVTIDYSTLDMSKMASDNTALKPFVNSKNRLTLNGAKAIYEATGAICK
ncbi:MAG: YehR family protein [Bacilli bacterium]|nr:YehR family protein [Bacilli bacterium]